MCFAKLRIKQDLVIPNHCHHCTYSDHERSTCTPLDMPWEQRLTQFMRPQVFYKVWGNLQCWKKSPLLESQVKSSQKYSSRELSQVIAIFFFKSSQVKSHNCSSQVKSSQVKSFFPSSHLKSVWYSVFPFCKVTKIILSTAWSSQSPYIKTLSGVEWTILILTLVTR